MLDALRWCWWLLVRVVKGAAVDKASTLEERAETRKDFQLLIDALQKDNADLRNRLDKLEVKHERLEQRFASQTSDLEELRRENATLRAENQQLRAMHERDVQRIGELERKQALDDQQLRDVRAQLEQIRKDSELREMGS